jgi:hypothetical protein
MKNALPNIFEYNDFRKFLNDYQKARHAQDRMFTKSELCKRLGIPIPGVMSMMSSMEEPSVQRSLID